MGLVRAEEIIAWQDGNQIFCAECGDPGKAIPLTEGNFEEGDVVICDFCNRPHRILQPLSLDIPSPSRNSNFNGCPSKSDRSRRDMVKVKVPWCRSEADFILSISDGEWFVSDDNELLHGDFDGDKPDKVKEAFDIYALSPTRTTGWLRLFCQEHHPKIDFDKEFRTDEPGVFARYHEKFGRDYPRWVNQERYRKLKNELAKKGYEISWK